MEKLGSSGQKLAINSTKLGINIGKVKSIVGKFVDYKEKKYNADTMGLTDGSFGDVDITLLTRKNN